MQRFGHMTRGAADGAAIVQLGCKHVLLHMPRKPEKEWQQQHQNQRKSAVLKPYHSQNADDPACIGKHADDAAGEQVFNGVYIAHEARYQRARLNVAQRISA